MWYRMQKKSKETEEEKKRKRTEELKKDQEKANYTKIEKDFYTFLKNKLTRSGVFLSIPINQSSIILKLIENGTLLWERRSQKLDEIKNVFVKVWREIEDE